MLSGKYARLAPGQSIELLGVTGINRVGVSGNASSCVLLLSGECYDSFV